MNEKTPFIRIAKREDLPKSRIWMIRAIAFAVAILLGALIFLIAGTNPFTAYGTIITSSLGKITGIRQVIKIAVPLLGTALALAPCFAMRFWNIGGEGQIIMGGVFATYFALFHADWPHLPLMIVCFLAGLIGGGVWGLIPALFKVKWNTNETLLTLMLNYIALYIISWLQNGPWRDPTANGFPKIAAFAKNAVLGKVLGVQAGWIVMLVFTVLVWVYLKFTKQGYEVAVVGESQDTARYAGIHVKKVILRTMFLSGAIGGVCGMLQACGTDATLSTGIAGGVGFTAIIVAWLCQLNPGMILVVSFLFGVLEKGSSVVQSSYGLSTDCAAVLQGIILFFILASEFFVRYAFAGRSSAKGGKKA